MGCDVKRYNLKAGYRKFHSENKIEFYQLFGCLPHEKLLRYQSDNLSSSYFKETMLHESRKL